jgi:hypothetical protein
MRCPTPQCPVNGEPAVTGRSEMPGGPERSLDMAKPPGAQRTTCVLAWPSLLRAGRFGLIRVPVASAALIVVDRRRACGY